MNLEKWVCKHNQRRLKKKKKKKKDAKKKKKKKKKYKKKKKKLKKKKKKKNRCMVTGYKKHMAELEMKIKHSENTTALSNSILYCL